MHSKWPAIWFIFSSSPDIDCRTQSENQPISEKSRTFAIDKFDSVAFRDQIWDQIRKEQKKLDNLAFEIIQKVQITRELEQN